MEEVTGYNKVIREKEVKFLIKSLNLVYYGPKTLKKLEAKHDHLHIPLLADKTTATQEIIVDGCRQGFYQVNGREYIVRIFQRKAERLDLYFYRNGEEIFLYDRKDILFGDVQKIWEHLFKGKQPSGVNVTNPEYYLTRKSFEHLRKLKAVKEAKAMEKRITRKKKK